MFIVFLKYSTNHSQAGQFMDAHKLWIKRGFDDGAFLLAGSLEPNLGGLILALDTSRASLEQRLDEDPFVAEDVVTVEIHEVDPAKADERLAFLVP